MISINATLFVQIINLLVLIYVLNRIMYRPIMKITEERAAKVNQGNAEAERIAEQTRDGEHDYLQRLNEGRAQVRAKLQELRQEVDHRSTEILQRAGAEAKERQAKLVTEIETQLAESRSQIKAEAENVARSMARQLLGREVS